MTEQEMQLVKDMVALLIRFGVKVETDEHNTPCFVGLAVNIPVELLFEIVEIYHADW
jgi:hypothetical protein